MAGKSAHHWFPAWMGYDSHTCSCMKMVKVPQWMSGSYYFAPGYPPFFSFFLSPPSTDFIPCTMCSQKVSRLTGRWHYDRSHSSARLSYRRIWGVISCRLQLYSMHHCKIMTCGVWLCVVPSVICAPSANGTLYGKNICIKFHFKLHKTVNETIHVSKKQSISLSVYQSIISMPTDSMTNTMQYDTHANCFLWHSWNCAPQTHSTDTNICVDFYNKMCGKNNLRSGIMEAGSTIITLFQHTLCLCRNFWTIMATLLTCTLRTLWMWHPQSFSFSQN